MLWLGCSFLLFVFYLFYWPGAGAEEKKLLGTFLEQKLALILIPVAMIALKKRTPFELLRYAVFFVFVNIIHGLVTNFYLIAQQGITLFNHHVNYRESFERATQIHPTYYGMYLVFSQIILLYMVTRMHRLWYIFFHLFIAILLLILSPKIAILTSLVVWLFYGINMRKNGIQFMYRPLILSVVILLTASWFIPVTRQRIIEACSFIGISKPVEDNSLMYRQLILKVDQQMIKESGIWGLGPVTLEKKLKASYDYISFLTMKPMGFYNTHNEYINQWLLFGWMGLLVYLAYLIIPVYLSIRTGNWSYLSVDLILILFGLTENYLSRQYGILFTTMVGTVFLLEVRTKEPFVL
ncbi:MAG TPA: O-antigen ligase family protein [Chitinophagaceae bacterium]|nr:O-antigen ligase family protein [Chitinophagaceae bacterium]